VPRKISMRIDGEMIGAIEGQNILQAARAAGKYIPALCYMEGLTAAGACRLCAIEVSGVNRLLPACTTPAADRMSLTTNSAKLQQYRKIALELLFAERNHICAICVSNGHCELQDLAIKHGLTSIRYPYRYPKLPVDVSHSRFVLDHNRCVLCTRCVRVCHEVEGAHVWDVGSRGVNSRIVCELNLPWGESKSCTSCGKCVQVCPTGALAEKGRGVEEMVKREDPISQLVSRRGATL
jgi:bidirectional [NiFe] hydrogenase diaphorase subunit